MPMELLSPAGDLDALKAAVQNGANAVYFGAKGFNARRGAENFFGDGLVRAVEYCHERNVRVHITLNTLVRHDELPALTAAIREIDRAGADAVIVQDLGVAEAVRQLAPGLKLHASTQMAIHNVQGVDWAREHGFSRVVLARELPLEEIRLCASRGIEVEVFAHGALCVSCSGQCLFSSLVGGRSGNRGACAQPCRLPYALDDRHGYLLSPKDLMMLELLPELRRAGAASLKIEGRMKRPEYVAVVTSVYRKRLDTLEAGSAPASLKEEEKALLQMFNRGGFSTGYLLPLRDDKLMYPERPNHMGLQVGVCKRDGSILLSEEIDTRDALALRRPGTEDIPCTLSGHPGDQISLKTARRGDQLFRLVSARQMDEAAKSCQEERVHLPVDASLTAHIGHPIALHVTCGERSAVATGNPVEEAHSSALNSDRVRQQISKTGGTPYVIRDLHLDADANAHIPLSALNQLRRDALQALSTARTRQIRPVGANELQLPAQREAPPEHPALVAESSDPEVLLRALSAGADELALMPKDLRIDALERDFQALKGHSFRLALPPVMGSQTLSSIRSFALEHAGALAGVSVSNLGQLALDWPGCVTGDYMLGAMNTLTVEELLSAGISRYTPSVELNAGQLRQLFGPKELVVYGLIPLMQLRHCPLRAGDTSIGGAHADCRRCDAVSPGKRLQDKYLTDRKGVRFPLRRIASEEGCLVQVMNSVPVFLLRRAGRIRDISTRWRLLLEPSDPVESLVQAHRACLDSAENGKTAVRPADWAVFEQMNTTTGHYFRGVE